jgi:diguanylate cyclase (GGDEF)-like protein
VIADRIPVRFRGDIRRACGALSAMPRSRLYPVLGLSLALAAPVGLLVARAIAAGHLPTLAWTLADIAHLAPTYAYVGLSTVGASALLGYVLGRSFDRVRRLSITDPLTGVFNRRHFGHRVAQEVRRGWRQGYPTCLLCLDIDRLKAINDGYGHQAGDRAIVAMSEILARNVRDVDAVARTGGDEFAVLLAETSATQALALSRRILRAVARHSDATSGGLAVSIGITELGASEDVESVDLLAAGDAALYRAKAAGGGHAVFVLAGQYAASPGRLARATKPAIALDDGVDRGSAPEALGPRPGVRGPSGSMSARWPLLGWMGNRRGPVSGPDGRRVRGHGEHLGDDTEDAAEASEMSAGQSDEGGQGPGSPGAR